MKVTYLAHSSFLLETSGGARIITDPYEAGGFGGEIGYKPITEKCDAISISHEHADHNWTKDIPGKPTIIKRNNSVWGITFKSISSFHDPIKGKQRGKNTIFVFNADGINFCHLGDLGHTLNEEYKKKIGLLDVLFLPVGGLFTIGPEEATQVMNLLSPKLVIPMHYKTKSIGFHLASVTQFTKDKKRVKETGGQGSEITLPAEQEIWVFTPTLL
ncbi:MAG: MBL fold metallo-hydrolase [Candidatus Stahlbacteria bacterium]|nr:MBL fold metallo-hydrolase [Candidatus Stahlbacteria bacterium]